MGNARRTAVASRRVDLHVEIEVKEVPAPVGHGVAGAVARRHRVLRQRGQRSRKPQTEREPMHDLPRRAVLGSRR